MLIKLPDFDDDLAERLKNRTDETLAPRLCCVLLRSICLFC
ncbi:hypothetical protein [Pseudomonas aeruginosa]|nr:hypothetical protein [Pseudomonas aeruginosa]MCT7418427.1 hypothetical protein [Pseudomonas aeruginosa]